MGSVMEIRSQRARHNAEINGSVLGSTSSSTGIAIVATIIALVPTIVFAMSVIVFQPEAFGFSMNPYAVAALYVGIFGPPASSLLFTVLLLCTLPESRTFRTALIAFLLVVGSNYFMCIAILLFINGLLPNLGVDWPRI